MNILLRTTLAALLLSAVGKRYEAAGMEKVLMNGTLDEPVRQQGYALSYRQYNFSMRELYES